LETGAVGEDGKLKVERSRALNKVSINIFIQNSEYRTEIFQVGHALHWLHPKFKDITFSDKIKQVCKKLGMEEPAVVQSMYIYKNPGVGSEGKILFKKKQALVILLLT